MRTNAHILIDQTLMPGQPPVDLEINLLSSNELAIENREHEIMAYACLEWAIPSFIGVYITKSYFEGFLAEMGAGHYQVLKKWLFKQNEKFKGIFTEIITASKSPEKHKNSNSPSNYFALYITIPQGNLLKVFMPNCESEKEDNEALSILLEDIKKLYSKPKSKFSKKINGLTDKVYEELYAVYNKNSNIWEFYTMSMLYQKSLLS